MEEKHRGFCDDCKKGGYIGKLGEEKQSLHVAWISAGENVIANMLKIHDIPHSPMDTYDWLGNLNFWNNYRSN